MDNDVQLYTKETHMYTKETFIYTKETYMTFENVARISYRTRRST